MQRVINFLKYGSNVLIVSVILTLIGLIYTFFYHGGYNWGIDFSPRVNINLSIEKSDIKENEIKRIFSPLYKALEVISIFSPNNNKSEFSIMVKSDVIDYAFKTEVQKTIMDELKKTFNVNIEVLDSYFIDSSFSSTLRIKSIFLVLGTFALILIYITLRFKLSYAIASILSTFHDIFFIVAFLGVTVGTYSSVFIASPILLNLYKKIK